MKEFLESYNILPCACGDINHHLIYHLDPETNQIWVYYQLVTKPWYERIVLGIKYIFGYQSKFGMYGDLLINENNVHKLEEMVDHVYKNNFINMKQYHNYSSIDEVDWTKYKIIVPTENDRQELMKAFKNIHYSDVDTENIAVNQLIHEYLDEENVGCKNNIIVDTNIYDGLTIKK